MIAESFSDGARCVESGNRRDITAKAAGGTEGTNELSQSSAQIHRATHAVAAV